MLSFRFATEKDIHLYFQWANDETTRKNSYNSDPISFENHIKWFEKRLNNDFCKMYLFFDEKGDSVGQVRIETDQEKNEALIGISVDLNHRGKGYSSEMIQMATNDFLTTHHGFCIYANVFVENIPSYKSFLKAGYILLEQKEIVSIPSYILIKKI